MVAHLRAQLPATTLLLAGLLPRGFAGDRTGQWQTRRAGADERDWPNPFSPVRAVALQQRVVGAARGDSIPLMGSLCLAASMVKYL